MLKFPLYLDEASGKKYRAAAAKQQQNKAEEMSKIPSLNIDRAKPRHPGKSMYTAAAE